ncbi:MAG: hypothetical protein WBC06_05635 [Chitinophagaceae bacterium]
MEESILDSVPEFKVYSEPAVRLATFFGGPLIAGYFIAENFISFGHPEKVKVTWMYAIAAAIIIFGGVFLIPGIEKIPSPVIPIAYAWTASLIVRQTQGNEIKKHLEIGGQLFSGWRVALISLIGLVITVGIIFILVLLTDKQLYF